MRKKGWLAVVIVSVLLGVGVASWQHAKAAPRFFGVNCTVCSCNEIKFWNIRPADTTWGSAYLATEVGKAKPEYQALPSIASIGGCINGPWTQYPSTARDIHEYAEFDYPCDWRPAGSTPPGPPYRAEAANLDSYNGKVTGIQWKCS